MATATSSILFDDFQIGNLRMKNRIVMPAMTTNFGNADGTVSERLIHYYEARAGGEVGLVIVEPACVDYPRGQGLIHELNISNDDCIAGLQKLAAAIKKLDVPTAIQLHHAGWLRFHCEPIAARAISPSAVKYRGYDAPAAMGEKQIRRLVEHYAQAAMRARQAGFDAVEVHGAHGYLIAQFLSPRNNQRSDGYGGTLVNRARLFVEIIQAIRFQTGDAFPILCRIDAEEFADGGITNEHSCELSKMLESAGANAIHVSVNTTPAKSTKAIVSNVPPMGADEGPWVDLAAKIKKSCTIPVVAVGNIRTVEFAEHVLVSHKADLIAVGRQLVADPLWPRKIRTADLQNIRPCINCNCCIRQVTTHKSTLSCTVNAKAGREKQFNFKPRGRSKRVLVLGGGPAGMEAAAAAARFGHDVELWEKENNLGGQLILAAVPPEKKILYKLLDYLKYQLVACNVKVSSGFSWTLQDVAALKPDVALVAIGSEAQKPPLLIDDGCTVLSARQVLSGSMVNDKQILIAGGGGVGCEVADYLLKSNRAICIVEQKAAMAPDMDPIRRRKLLLRLKNGGVDLRVNMRLLRITAKGAEVTSLEGAHELIAADTVVHAGESKSRIIAMAGLEELVPEIFIIGDAIKPRGIPEAIMEGCMIAYRI